MLLASACAYRPALSDIDLGLILECARVRYRRSLQAEPLFKRALAIAEKALEPDHSLVATSVNNLATLYYAQGQYVQAESLLKRALAIDEKALGPNHPDVARDRNNLAALYRATKRGKEAETLERRTARIRAIQR